MQMTDISSTCLCANKVCGHTAPFGVKMVIELFHKEVQASLDEQSGWMIQKDVTVEDLDCIIINCGE